MPKYRHDCLSHHNSTISRRPPKYHFTSSSSCSAYWYPLLDVGLPFLLPFRTVHCHLLPVCTCCSLNSVCPSLWWSAPRSCCGWPPVHDSFGSGFIGQSRPGPL